MKKIKKMLSVFISVLMIVSSVNLSFADDFFIGTNETDYTETEDSADVNSDDAVSGTAVVTAAPSSESDAADINTDDTSAEDGLSGYISDISEKNDINMANAAATVYIDGANGSDSNTGLTDQTAVKTMPKAIELAEENYSGENINIQLLSQITVADTQSWVFDDYITVLEPADLGSSSSGYSSIYIDNGGNLSISGMNFVGGGNYPAIQIQSHNASLSNADFCSFKNCKYGIELISLTDANVTYIDTIENCTFENCLTGISIGMGSGITNTITDCNFINCGVCIDNLAFINSIANCKFTDFSNFGIANATQINSITDCSFKGFLSDSSVGIQAYTKVVSVDNCIIHGCKYGLYGNVNSIKSLTTSGNTYGMYLTVNTNINPNYNALSIQDGIYLSSNNYINLYGSVTSAEDVIEITVDDPDSEPIVVSSTDNYKISVNDYKMFTQSHGDGYCLKYYDNNGSPYIKLKNSYGITYYSDNKVVRTINESDYGCSSFPVDEPLSRYGYSFEGWYTTADCKDGTEFDPDMDLTDYIEVYAKWTRNNYTAAFYMNDGTNTLYDTAVISVDGFDSFPTDPTRENYTFDGWYYDIECDVLAEETDDNFSSDINIYAKWILNEYDVTYHLNYGTDDVYIIQKGDVNGLSFPTSPTRTGYTFGGWYYTPNCSGSEVEDGESVECDIDVYAKWIRNNYTATFYINDGTNTVYDTAVISVDGFDSFPTDPTRENYTFGGWFYDSSCDDSSVECESTDYPFTANTNIYAKWIFNGSADLSITKEVDKTAARVGETVVYTITVTNNGTAAGKNVAIQDVLSEQLQYVSSDNNGNFDSNTNTVKWVLAEILPGQQATLTLTAKIK